MQSKSKTQSRKKIGEEFVSVLVREALQAGATIGQLERETGCDRAEIERILSRIETLESLEREIELESH